MRKIAVTLAPLLILAIALTAIGCGGGESPTPTPSPEPSPTATAEPTPEPTVAPTPTPSPIPTTVPTLGTKPPCRFYGTVQLNGADVADGTIITVIIDGDEYTTTTPAVYGHSTYAIKTVPSIAAAYAEGADVTFMIGDYTADLTGGWETGGNIKLDLTASTT